MWDITLMVKVHADIYNAEDHHTMTVEAYLRDVIDAVPEGGRYEVKGPVGAQPFIRPAGPPTTNTNTNTPLGDQ